MDRVWLNYVRKSVVRDETDLESPERQIYVCSARLTITETKPYTVEIYQDLDRSGSTESGRPEWLRLKEQLDRPEVVGVIASSLDRLYRNVGEFLNFLSLIETHNKVLITAKESLDTSSPLGRFVVTILMALFEMEWRLTSARMTEMIEFKRRRQGRHWGVAPFGTDRDDNGQLVPTGESYTVKGETRRYYDSLTECFRLYSTGQYSYEDVATALNAAGWRFCERSGKETRPQLWDKERVRGVVNRWRLYRGELPMGNPVKSRTVEWLDGGHAPIVPVDLANDVGQILTERGRWGGGRLAPTRHIYLLSDVLFCACCKGELNGQTHHGKRMYRHALIKRDCPEKWIEAGAIESQVITALTGLEQHSTLLNDISEGFYELAEPDKTRQARINDAYQRLERLEDIYINERQITKESYIERRQVILNELASLEGERPQEDVSAIVRQLVSFLSVIHRAEDKTKKALINHVTERLEVKDGQIEAFTPKEWLKPLFDCATSGPGGSLIHLAQLPTLFVWFFNANVEERL